jgi:peroxisomal 2,4-dienoyl-CoA reductase
MGEADEIGHAAVFLSAANYITGDVLIVDGGEWLYKPPMVPREMVSELSRQVEATSRSQAPRSKL